MKFLSPNLLFFVLLVTSRSALAAGHSAQNSCPQEVIRSLGFPKTTESHCLKGEKFFGSPAWIVLSVVPEAYPETVDENAGVTFSVLAAGPQPKLVLQQSGFGEELLPIQITQEGKSRVTSFEVLEQPRVGWVALFRTTTPTSSIVVMKRYDPAAKKLVSVSPHQSKTERASEFFVAGLGDRVTLKTGAQSMELSMAGAYPKRYPLKDGLWILEP